MNKRQETELEKILREKQTLNGWKKHCKKIAYPVSTDERIYEIKLSRRDN